MLLIIVLVLRTVSDGGGNGGQTQNDGESGTMDGESGPT